MKKYLYLTAALAIVGAVSCNKEISDNTTPDAPEVKLATLTATIGEPGTKTTLATPEDAHNNGSKTYWCAEDRLSVFDGENNVEYSVKESENYEAAEEAVFEGAELADAEAYYALYPYTETATLEDGAIKGAVLPAEQTAVAGNIPEGAALAAAYTEDRSEVYFKNVATTIGFTLTEPAGKVEFIAKGGQDIAGTIDITFDGEGLPTYEVQDGTGSNTVTLTDLAAGTYYFTILPDVTLTQGYELKIEGYTAKTGAVGKKLERSMIYSLGEVTLIVPEWTIAGTFNGWDMKSNPMILADGYYVAKNVTGLSYTAPTEEGKGSETGIKFVNNGNTWRGGEGQVSAGIWAYVWESGNNIYVEGATAETAYDIYLNPEEGDYGKFVIVAAGEDMPDDTPVVEPEDTWGIIGDCTGSAWETDIEMAEVNNMFVAYDVVFAKEGSFKIRANKTWDNNDAKNIGLSTTGKVKAGFYYDVIASGGSGNLTVAAGTYDIWFDLVNMHVYLMTPDSNPDTASKGNSEDLVQTRYIYLNTTKNWSTNSPNFIAHFWGGTAMESPVMMDKVNTNLYKCQVPTDATDIIFVRRDPSNNESDLWKGEWNRVQTKLDANKDLFTITDWGAGSWSVYSEN